jgi:Rieske Fe-S protein
MSSIKDVTASTSATVEPPRRSFLARFAALTFGGVAAAFPFAVGWGVLFDPLRRGNRASTSDKSDTTGFTRIAPLEALPADATPHKFVVTSDVVDAWSRTRAQRIGAVFLARTDADSKPHITAFTATCPHLGCAVEFDAGDGRFECPCHESGFGKDGRKLFGPSLRGLDPLEVKLVDKGDSQEIWVAFQRFRAGVAERIPVG